MANLICKHCGRTMYEALWGCRESDRPCGGAPFDAEAYAKRYSNAFKNSPAWIKQCNADFDKIFGGSVGNRD
jgi:hypothetical protein